MSTDQNQQPLENDFESGAAADRRDSQERDDAGAPKSNGCRNIAIGCGCLTVLLLVVGIGVGLWVQQNWKGLAADAAKMVAQQAVQEAEMPAADKQRVLDRLNRLADDFKSGKISTEQMVRVFEEVAQSPLFPIAMVMFAEKQYVGPSGLTAEEKQAAKRTLQRLARGSFEKSISSEKLEEVMSLIQIDQGNGQKKMKEKLTDDELKTFLARAQQVADEAAVPDEPFEVNIPDELDKAIDDALMK